MWWRDASTQAPAVRSLMMELWHGVQRTDRHHNGPTLPEW